WIQRTAADCVFRGRLRVRPNGHSHWNRYVTRRRESLSVVRQVIRGQAVGPFHSFPHHAQLPCFPCGPCNFGRDDGIRSQYESHCAGHGYLWSSWNVAGLLRDWRGGVVLGCRALAFLAASAAFAARAEVHHLSDAVAYAEPACSATEIRR